MTTIKFAKSTMTVDGDEITSTFSDGKINKMNIAWLNTPEYREIADEMGYRGDWRRYAIHHDLIHHWLADRLFLGHSWSLYQNPDREKWQAHIDWEEHIVNHLQKLMMAGVGDSFGVLNAVFHDPRIEVHAIVALIWDNHL